MPEQEPRADSIAKSADVRETISRAIADLSPRNRQVALYCLNHGDDIAFMTVRQIADAVRVSPATVVRMVRNLGFPSFEAFREAFRCRFRGAAIAEPVDLAEGSVSQEPEIAAIARKVIGGDLTRLFAGSLAETGPRIARRLVNADSVSVAGFRSAHAFAYYFSYLAQMAFSHFALVGHTESLLLDRLVKMSGDAVAVIFSFAPYSIEAVRFAELAAASGIDVIAVTDTPASPLVRHAIEYIEVPTGRTAHLPSLVAALAICELLLEFCIAEAGETASAEISGFEAKVRRLNGYW